MNIRKKYFLFSAASVILMCLIPSILAIWFYKGLTPSQASVLLDTIRPYFISILIGGAILFTFFVFTFDSIYQNYILPISRLTEETQIIQTVNPAYRLKLQGSVDIQQVAHLINKGADRIEALSREMNEQISKATFETEVEKNILAAIITELPEGVIICNAGGQILLFNNRAKAFLGTDVTKKQSTKRKGEFIGLGRSIFGIIDRNCIVYALDEISEKLLKDQQNAAAYFVIAGKKNNLLRVETVPVLNPQRQFTGFIILMNDITEQLGTNSRIVDRWQTLITRIRHSSAGIRSAAEAILAYPEMESEQSRRFMDIIHKESVTMGKAIQEDEAMSSELIQTQWPVVQIHIADLMKSFVKRTDEKLDVDIDVQTGDENVWVKICPYSFILAMLYVLDLMVKETGKQRFACGIKRQKKFLTIEFAWKGVPVKIETIRKWSTRILALGNESIPVTLKAVMGYHHAELWSYSSKDHNDLSYLGIYLPAVDIKEPGIISNVAILPESRPEFYDFNLFSQPGQVPETDNRLLTELSYTVFDTETTGLNPGGGDEIISIGAVRIVNNRLLREDVFDQLVDPQRDLPAASIKFHGIQEEMLHGQPTINEVLPRFKGFTEDTILVAHNAAFDMRMLQVKEESTGIKFINPVMDTMLLSAVVHPSQNDHSMEAIAERLGVQVVGRHTALGDALVTGEMFLKLVPLLLEKDITTLKAARLASQKTFHARLKY